MESRSLFSLNRTQYLNIFENMQEEVHIHELVRNKHGKIIDFVFKYINPASTLNSILPREKIIGQKASAIYKSHEPLNNYLNIVDEVVTTGKSSKFETYYRILDKYFLISAFSINGLFVTLGIDITKQKEAEDQIQVQVDILSQVRDSVIAVDNENRITYWNKGAENLYGFKFEEVKSKIFLDVVNYRWLNLNDKKKAYRQLKTTGKWHGENLSTKKNGEEIHIESSINAFKDDKSNYIGTIFIIHDITEPVHMKTALEENYKRLQEAQRIGHIGNWEWDIQNNIITWSDELYNIYGLDPNLSGAKYETILDMVHPEDHHIVNETLEKALKDHKPFTYEVRICRQDGDIRMILCHGEVLTDFAGHPLKIICVEQDISERKKIEDALLEAKNELEIRVEERTKELSEANKLLQFELEERKRTEYKLKKSEENLKLLIDELKRSNEELQQFAYVSSHDLQEPLRTISNFTQLLERRYKDKLDSDADEFIDYIVEAAKRMQTLINDLLGYSRVSTRGKEFELVDTKEILENTMSNLHAAIEENNAEITHDKLPKIMADKRQMIQLFQNLVGNAIKFRKEELPKIHISAFKDDERNEYVFSVQDNGIGMEPQYLERIFIIFQRLHTRDEYEGTGIGLAVSKKIVERHGGHIWVESEFTVRSTFYFTIPIKEAPKIG